MGHSQPAKFGAGWLGKVTPGLLHVWGPGTLAPEMLPPELLCGLGCSVVGCFTARGLGVHCPQCGMLTAGMLHTPCPGLALPGPAGSTRFPVPRDPMGKGPRSRPGGNGGGAGRSPAPHSPGGCRCRAPPPPLPTFPVPAEPRGRGPGTAGRAGPGARGRRRGRARRRRAAKGRWHRGTVPGCSGAVRSRSQGCGKSRGARRGHAAGGGALSGAGPPWPGRRRAAGSGWRRR